MVSGVAGPSLELLEAICHRKMAELAAMPPARGFDTAKARVAKQAEVDEALDVYNLAKSVGL